MTGKLHIDLSQGIFEAEGSEEFLLQVYGDFKDKLAAHQGVTPKVPTMGSTKTKTESQPKSGSSSKRRTRTKRSYSIVGDLSLVGDSNRPGLKDFISQFKISTNFEHNTVFVYYLRKHGGFESGITCNHVFTCYKTLQIRVPQVYQSLLDTANRKGWLDTKSMEDIRITTVGENYVEHDLPRASVAAE